jgi:hypothetical protein
VRKPGISSLVNYVRKIDAGASREKTAEKGSNGTEGVPLREYDESERVAVQESRTVLYRNRDRKITNALCAQFISLRPIQGQRKNEYDVLLRNYDQAGRDLLIEVKPDPDRGSLRIAIGQLYDYRRFLRNAAATDLAVLTIGKPNRSYLDLLLALGITSVWFEGESCRRLQGVGTAWRSLRYGSG